VFSNEINKARLRILKAQEDGVQLVLSKARARLVEISKPGQKYQELLKKLILEVCFTLRVYLFSE
jgi:vacuolar-type H+-ATPase subunit E/Vma4